MKTSQQSYSAPLEWTLATVKLTVIRALQRPARTDHGVGLDGPGEGDEEAAAGGALHALLAVGRAAPAGRRDHLQLHQHPVWQPDRSPLVAPPRRHLRPLLRSLLAEVQRQPLDLACPDTNAASVTTAGAGAWAGRSVTLT